MKRNIALILSLLMILSCFALASCGSKKAEKPAEEPAQEEEAAAPEESEDQTDPVDGASYGYEGDDPVVAAVYQYLVEHAADNFDIPADAVTIPIVQILTTKEADNGDVLVYGDFWMMNYQIDGDTLKNISGGDFPGKMTCIQVGSGYSAQKLDVCEDGGGFEESARKIFGDNYDAFIKIQSDDKTREIARGEIIATYVKANKLDVTKYQDEGSDPVDIPQ